jgi:hypothetical protein
MQKLSYKLFIGTFLLLALATNIALAADKDDKKNKKTPTTGQITIKTTPGTYPILINGKPSGLSGNTAPTEITLPPGTYTVEVLFPNKTWQKDVVVNAGRRSCICLGYTTKTITKPCPYDVTVSAPDEVNDGDLVTFAAIPNYNGAGTLTYLWTVTPDTARITSGQGTPSITIDTTGLGDQIITAKLDVNDGSTDPNCQQDTMARTRVRKIIIPNPEPRKFDEFNSVSFDDDKARLDNFALELQQNPDAQGYIIVYGGIAKRSIAAERLGTRTMDYLTKTRKVDPRRLVVANGGYRERTGYELWIVPPGASLPVPTPTVTNPNSLKRPTKKRNR